ncbi:MAG: OsmC family protein [Lautropia sp.]
MNPPLATSTVFGRLSNEPGRALVSVRGQHLVVDSPPPLGGPNEAANPAELLLAAFGTCCVFVCERAATEMGIALHAIEVTAAGDFDPRGVCGEAFDPRFQAFRMRIAMRGPDDAQRKALVDAFRSRCPVYTTMSRAGAPIEITIVELAVTPS